MYGVPSDANPNDVRLRDPAGQSSVNATVSVSGVHATAAVGAVVVLAAATATPTGVQAAGAVGAVAAGAGAVPTVGGVSAGAAVGTVVVTGGANAMPAGVYALAEVGVVAIGGDAQIVVPPPMGAFFPRLKERRPRAKPLQRIPLRPRPPLVEVPIHAIVRPFGVQTLARVGRVSVTAESSPEALAIEELLASVGAVSVETQQQPSELDLMAVLLLS